MATRKEEGKSSVQTPTRKHSLDNIGSVKQCMDQSIFSMSICVGIWTFCITHSAYISTPFITHPSMLQIYINSMDPDCLVEPWFNFPIWWHWYEDMNLSLYPEGVAVEVSGKTVVSVASWCHRCKINSGIDWWLMSILVILFPLLTCLPAITLSISHSEPYVFYTCVCHMLHMYESALWCSTLNIDKCMTHAFMLIWILSNAIMHA